MISLHLVVDVLGWAVLLVVSGIMTIWELPILDPILSIVYSLFIFFHVAKNLKEIGYVFLEGFQGHVDMDQLKEKLLSFEHVKDVHHMHYWTLDGNINMVTMHVRLDQSLACEAHDHLIHEMKHVLTDFGFEHSTIEIEYQSCQDENCQPQINTSHHHHHH